MTSLQAPGRQNNPEPFADLVEKIRAMQGQLNDVASAVLRSAGISVSPEGMTVDRALEVLGSLEVAGDATFTGDTTIGGNTTISGATGVSGTLSVTGDAVFLGDLAVPNGSITNDALASPLVIVAAAPATSSGWAVGTGMAAMASSSIPVPAGFSRATVVAWANMHFMDSAPNGGWVRATIQGSSGAEMGGLANLQLGQSASHTHALTGLSGGSLSVSCDVRASVGTGGMSGRIAQITAVGFFQR